MKFSSRIFSKVTEDIMNEVLTIWEAYEKEVRSFSDVTTNDKDFEKIQACFPSFESILEQAVKELRDMARNT